MLPNTEGWPKPELCPNAGVAVLCPKSPAPVLLAVFALLVPKENELTLLAVEAPKRPALVLVLLGLAPNDVWPKEKPAAVSELLTGCPKLFTCPNTGLPNPEPNPAAVNPVGWAGVGGTGAAVEAGVAVGCPNTETEAVVVVLTVVRVGVEVTVATVLITGEAPTVVLSVVTGTAWVNIEPGASEVVPCDGAGGVGASETGAASEVATATAAGGSAVAWVEVWGASAAGGEGLGATGTGVTDMASLASDVSDAAGGVFAGSTFVTSAC